MPRRQYDVRSIVFYAVCRPTRNQGFVINIIMIRYTYTFFHQIISSATCLLQVKNNHEKLRKSTYIWQRAVMILQLVEVHSAIGLTWRRPLQSDTSCVVPRDDDVTRGTWRCNDDTPRTAVYYYVTFPIEGPFYALISSVCQYVYPVSLIHKRKICKKFKFDMKFLYYTLNLQSHVEVKKSKVTGQGH